MSLPDLALEKELWKEDVERVVGLDEAGRGPWAGPVSIAGVLITTADQIVEGVNDSKKLSPKKREKLYEEIIINSTAFGVSLVSANKVDKLGIVGAIAYGMFDVIAKIEKKMDKRIQFLIIDGETTPDVEGYKCKKINRADSLYYSVAAASIIAKVTRDRKMAEYAKQYPQYGFDSHVGYGTKAHRAMLDEYGVCPIHRMSFRPMKDM